jgi:hypothetical protein
MAMLTAVPATSVRRRAVLVLLATLLAHAVLLERIDRMLAGATTEGPQQEASVTARLLPPPAPPVPLAPPPPAPRPPPRPQPAPAVPPVPAAEPARMETARIGAFGEEPAVAQEPPTVAEPAASTEPTQQTVAEAEPEEIEAGGEVLRKALAQLPALPSSARYVYRTTNSEIRLATGATTVEWTLAGDGRYRLRMTTVALGMTVLELDSQGSLREYGLAPERYVETRARRSPEAANFDWDGRRVTFSARAHERPLVDGAQDRISFQIQLMLLGQARPEWFRPGARTVMQMAGRDDMASYRFRSAGRETTQTGLGPLEAVRLERVTARDSDARIEVWLAPSLAWLPVRLRFTDRYGRVTESVLESVPTS